MFSLKGLFTFALLLVSVYADCPNVKDSDITPCVCLTNQIRCEGPSVTNDVLAKVLATIDKSRSDYQKEFDGLELYNTKVTKVTTEIFGKLVLKTFAKFNSNPISSVSLGNFPDLVYLDLVNNNLSKTVDSNLFLGLKSLRFVNLGGNDIEDFPRDTFAQSDNLQRIVLSGNKIKRLESDEFSSEYHNNIELTEVDLSNNALTLLPNNIFWPLRRPLSINLAHNKLATGLEVDALSFGEDAIQYEPIRLILSDNGFKDENLLATTFAHIVRQKLSVALDLSDNGVTKLTDKVFQDLLRANRRTTVTLNGNPIKCADCANKWIPGDIAANKVRANQIQLTKCTDDAKRTLTQYTAADYKDCK
ncbi:leucine-rich repeat-containing protein let-4-like [Oppia nitens]|uniref:leucine-rich repeat-containing protein let-4-like n=1 Tax=Oppia nitens TaxID=1686743 RepID=UPI0023D9AEDD|nr:leucine-rich repeat-containing protein let-4-like [Oppia nitens]